MKKSDLTNKDEYELNFPRYDIQRYDIQRYDIQRYNIQRYEIERYEKQIYRWYEIDKIRQIDIDHLDKQFKKKTSIVNKTDLIILAVATAIMAAKGVLYPIVSEKCGYGKKANTSERMDHNDKKIEERHKEANDKYRDKKLKKHEKGEWIEILYRTPPYDITVGSRQIGRNMEGKYHRIHTLGHDPVLGWIFGTANIMTDIITYEDFASYRVTRKPMKITQIRVPLSQMFLECFELMKKDSMYLPVALFAEGQHLLSDKYTKLGLPIPVLETFSPELAGKLYKENYDQLCLERDIKIIGSSVAISVFFNMIIGLIHGLFYDEQKDGNRDLYEVRTRKILTYSNIIGSTSNIIATIITKKPQSLDIGGLLVTISRMCMDARFIYILKKEYMQNNAENLIN